VKSSTALQRWNSYPTGHLLATPSVFPRQAIRNSTERQRGEGTLRGGDAARWNPESDYVVVDFKVLVLRIALFARVSKDVAQRTLSRRGQSGRSSVRKVNLSARAPLLPLFRVTHQAQHNGSLPVTKFAVGQWETKTHAKISAIIVGPIAALSRNTTSARPPELIRTQWATNAHPMPCALLVDQSADRVSIFT